MLKEIAIDAADLFAVFAKWRARIWLERSRWWDAAAEAMETGSSISEIRKQREGESNV
jgi:hypothetical protein